MRPEKDPATIRTAMAGVRLRQEEFAETSHTGRRRGRFAPAGQSTQMIVGADGSDDRTILKSATRLYSSYRLKRVYYSAFSPIPDASEKLPLVKAPLMREHRLYQSDWLLRFYDFTLDDIAPEAAATLDLTIDPKLAWALRNRGLFPVDVNRAPKEALLKVPGFGTKVVGRILAARRSGSLGYEELRRLGARLRQAQPFFVARDWRPRALTDAAGLREMVAPRAEQLELFG